MIEFLHPNCRKYIFIQVCQRFAEFVVVFDFSWNPKNKLKKTTNKKIRKIVLTQVEL